MCSLSSRVRGASEVAVMPSKSRPLIKAIKPAISRKRSSSLMSMISLGAGSWDSSMKCLAIPMMLGSLNAISQIGTMSGVPRPSAIFIRSLLFISFTKTDYHAESVRANRKMLKFITMERAERSKNNLHTAVVSLLVLALIAFHACASKHPAPLDLSYPTKPMQLPRDLAAHDWAQTEWWYYTGHLKAADGTKYGFELTFFRHRTGMDKSRGLTIEALGETGLMAHFALVDETTGRYLHEGLIEPQGKNANASTQKYDVFIYNWRAEGDAKSHHIKASASKMSLELTFKPLKPAVLHGDRGIVDKGNGLANYYMSYTRLAASGTLDFEGRKSQVDGIAWFDHEYGYMDGITARGWDWFSLQLEDNTEYMVYEIRNADHTMEAFEQGLQN